MVFIPLDEISDLLKSRGRYWITFTGDSLVSCEWVHPNWRDIVIYVLQNELTKYLKSDWKTSEWGIKGFNFAYDGSTTTDILQKCDDILCVNPDLVISLMGGNDPVLNVSVEKSVENIKKISQLVVSSTTKLVWSNSTPAGADSKKNLEYQPYAEAFMKIPENNCFLKIDMFNIYKSFPTNDFFTFLSEENPVEGIKKGEPDLQHPNQLGNAYIAKVILQEVFGISFKPDVYIQDTYHGLKFPSY